MPAAKDPAQPEGSDPNSVENGPDMKLDALIIGGGFSGIAMLHRLRQLNLTAKIFEAGGDLGGTWYWNRYPGARVDSEWPMYQLSIPEVYRDNPFRFSQRYPDHHEIRRYFAHVDSVIDVKRDTFFHARVVSCSWDDATARWTVRTAAGHVAVCKYLMLGSGVFAEGHTPGFAGLADFKGEVYHTSRWPQEKMPLDADSFKGTRVGLIGLGATGIRVVQEVAKTAEKLSVFVRRPSFCMPAHQQTVSDSTHDRWQPEMERLFKEGRPTPAGFPPSTPWVHPTGQGGEIINPAEKPSFHDHTPEQRQRFWETAWHKGGFAFARDNYRDVLTDEEANRGAYGFWAAKVRARMAAAGADARKMDILAPVPASRAPYHIFTKRVPLEVDFYDVVGRPNVELVDLTSEGFDTFNTTGVRLKDAGGGGRQVDLDVLILATGFDAFAGAVRNMGLKDRNGVEITKGHWRDGFRTYLGSMMQGFPNLFMVFTPHAPTAFSNAPTIIEAQCDLACSIVSEIESSAGSDAQSGRRIKTVEPTSAAEDEWAASIDEQTRATLLPNTVSWWNRSGPEGSFQSLNYIKGIHSFEKECRNKLEGWKGFQLTYWKDADGERNPTATVYGVDFSDMLKV